MNYKLTLESIPFDISTSLAGTKFSIGEFNPRRRPSIGGFNRRRRAHPSRGWRSLGGLGGKGRPWGEERGLGRRMPGGRGERERGRGFVLMIVVYFNF